MDPGHGTDSHSSMPDGAVGDGGVVFEFKPFFFSLYMCKSCFYTEQTRPLFSSVSLHVDQVCASTV